MSHERTRSWPRVAAAITLFFGAAAALAWLPVGDTLLASIEAAEELGPAGPVLFAVSYAVATLLWVPATPFSLSAGFLWGPKVGLLAAWAGEVLGAVLAFALSRTLLREVVARWVADRPLLLALDRAIDREGPKLLVLLRLSPLFPFGPLNYALGLSSARPVAYLASTAIGVLPLCAWLVWTGSTLPALSMALSGESDQAVGRELGFSLAGLVGTAIAVVAVTRAARRALAERIDPQDSSADSARSRNGT